jgi:hypothetical protein
MSITALNQGWSGLQVTQNHLGRDALAIANGGADAVGTVSPMIDLKIHETQALASINVIKAADSVIGTLIDVMA